MIKDRRASHVGVVVSFVIFITFLFFLYSILEPVTNRERDKQYILDYLKLSLIEESTENYTSVTIVVNSATTKTCINIQNIADDEIPPGVRDKLIIKNEEGDTLQYEIQGQGIEIKTGTGFVGILKVYYSDEISNSQTSIGGCDPKPYSVGIIKTYNEIFESKLEDLNESYYADYEGMKIEIGVPKGTEFSFYLYDGEKTEPPILSAEKSTPPETTSVYIEEVPIQYMDGEGNINFGFLRIKVW